MPRRGRQARRLRWDHHLGRFVVRPESSEPLSRVARHSDQPLERCIAFHELHQRIARALVLAEALSQQTPPIEQPRRPGRLVDLDHFRPGGPDLCRRSRSCALVEDPLDLLAVLVVNSRSPSRYLLASVRSARQRASGEEPGQEHSASQPRDSLDGWSWHGAGHGLAFPRVLLGHKRRYHARSRRRPSVMLRAGVSRHRWSTRAHRVSPPAPRAAPSPPSLRDAGVREGSVAADCEANGVDPEAYLADVLLRVKTHPASRIEELLPHRWVALGAAALRQQASRNGGARMVALHPAPWVADARRGLLAVSRRVALVLPWRERAGPRQPAQPQCPPGTRAAIQARLGLPML